MLIHCPMASERLVPDLYCSFSQVLLETPRKGKRKAVVKAWSTVQGRGGCLLLLDVCSDPGPADAQCWEMAGEPLQLAEPLRARPLDAACEQTGGDRLDL